MYSEFTISVLNSILINICQGYIHSWTGPKSKAKRHTAFFTNILPVVFGATLGILQHQLLFLSFIGVIGCGVTLYGVTMLLFPLLFNSQANITSQLLCALGGLFVTLIYYPLSHLMNA